MLPVTDSPLVVRTQVLRALPDDTSDKPLYASKFVDLIQDEEALIRKAVFSIQNRHLPGQRLIGGRGGLGGAGHVTGGIGDGNVVIEH